MTQTVLVTGATGLAGANVCKLLIERGDAVRALARETADTAPLAGPRRRGRDRRHHRSGAVLRAATGSDAAIHCAALLGGASQNLADFEAVNIGGTKNVLDAAEAVDLGRVVAVSTGTFFDTDGGLDREDAPVTKEPSSDPYTITKMAAFLDAMSRAAKGRDVVSTHPGAIFGPSPVASNALGMTSFNRVLLSAARGRIERYLKFPVSWVFAEDIARGCILALDKGVAGERYMLDGRPEDVVSIANACTRMCRLAGLDHEVVDVDPSDDPELVEVFGPTLMAIAEKAARETPVRRRSLDGLQDLQAARLRPHQPRRGTGADTRVVPGDRARRRRLGQAPPATAYIAGVSASISVAPAISEWLRAHEPTAVTLVPATLNQERVSSACVAQGAAAVWKVATTAYQSVAEANVARASWVPAAPTSTSSRSTEPALV